MSSNWTVFVALCCIIGGRGRDILQACVDAGDMPQLIAMATSQDVLPALAARCYEQADWADAISEVDEQSLRNALLENTRRNMHIVVQSVHLIRALNDAGIKPLMLKGTAQLLTINRERPGFRKQADIDFIVPPASLLAAGDALLAQGYGFYLEDEVFHGPTHALGDTHAAIKASAAHHHLPPLMKRDQVALVELHRHFLPQRFQHRNPLAELFDAATEHDIQGASFLVPSTEHQIIHMVLGKLVHDGYLARRTFPIREAADYIALLDSPDGVIDSERVARRCGKAFNIFAQLVTELMNYPAESPGPTSSVKYRIEMMRMRYDSPAPAKLLDGYARAGHLTCAMLHNPSKLSAYLRR
tara:strand:- start:1161 stop:2231 length:1071 start_codon:yes stop_codon:yes gene_type:complete